ncbi:hypothetical protein TSOC111612_00855 [Tsukamurella ocularis]|uniref:helix-turn-helix domain-containing protein n=1 Tax=Tsukamurella ocularis TaxID=1970234 RepID=UPI0039EFFA8A
MNDSQHTPLSQFIRNTRKERGISLRDFAARTGIDRTNLRRIENGQIAAPSPQTIERLARVLDVDVEEFYDLQWQTSDRPLPSMPTYFRTKFDSLSPSQIEQIEKFVTDLQDQPNNDRSP